MVWMLISIWIIGVLCIICMDAYFDWKLDSLAADTPPLFICAAFWPITLIIASCIWLHRHLTILGENNRKKQEERKKFRIAEEIQAKKLLQESEQEVEKFVEQLSQTRL